MDIALKEAYAFVQIPTNYIENKVTFINDEDDEHISYYFADVFTSIDVENRGQAYDYQELIETDPDDTSSIFAKTLKQIVDADKFDMSPPKMDIVPIAENSSDNGDGNGMEIIVWFLGVCAVCAFGALLLIVCWRKFSNVSSKDNDQNAINLEFLLDPNAPMDPNSNLFAAPMRINKNDDDDNECMDMDVNANMMIKNKKKKKSEAQFNRLSLDEDEMITGKNVKDADADDVNNDEESEEYEAEQDGDALMNMEDYEPPNMNGRL